ncbi:hypothetical protein [Pseudomonas sp. SM4]|uniref:hypothetical protein n=1 Tax=Pseudomonas sp. SM4 TaxID=3424177 RepID=UPI003F7A99C2
MEGVTIIHGCSCEGRKVYLLPGGKSGPHSRAGNHRQQDPLAKGSVTRLTDAYFPTGRQNFMRHPIIFSLCLLCSSQALADENHTDQARQTLKNYGLSHCLLAPFNEQSALRKDIALAAGAYSFMGKGMHTVLQNEDTLQVLHDPYEETRNHVSAAYDLTSANSKYSDEKMVFHACLQVYNSEAFERFIRAQDAYIVVD